MKLAFLKGLLISTDVRLQTGNSTKQFHFCFTLSSVTFICPQLFSRNQ